ncbi:hypothetical protein L202_04612 [Cryptococcus amylolentus CBS 6039]|uniref:Uncharacterized protein n=2 Tax=Cryptococcus amylolentus TaxID=104669 RepID=A0A1E3HM77_9TREE|nr:hypothetical protein L202_04612 [Cryptococcus amylolentus CBS 6039]ODN77434.1 hypothetical protein L202_04612 [Cryptococcus amylolentus CBS 6039]ODO05490.1 hypothetical protein I350_04541 [Cryptococcus amylolentus CBS 6273]
MALPTPSSAIHLAHLHQTQPSHPPPTSASLTTLLPLQAVHDDILDCLLEIAPWTYLSLSRTIREDGKARLSAPIDFDGPLLSRLYDTIQGRQDVRWLYRVTWSHTVRFPTYRLFAMTACLLGQAERQRWGQRQPAEARYPCRDFPTSLFARATCIEITIDENASLSLLYQQISAELDPSNSVSGINDIGLHLGSDWQDLAICLSDNLLRANNDDKIGDGFTGFHCFDTHVCMKYVFHTYKVTFLLAISDINFPNPSSLSPILLLQLLESACDASHTVDDVISIDIPTSGDLRRVAIGAIVQLVAGTPGHPDHGPGVQVTLQVGEGVGDEVWEAVSPRVSARRLARLKDMFCFKD